MLALAQVRGTREFFSYYSLSFSLQRIASMEKIDTQATLVNPDELNILSNQGFDENEAQNVQVAHDEEKDDDSLSDSSNSTVVYDHEPFETF